MLKTLAKSDRAAKRKANKRRKAAQQPVANGIACPNCGEELLDTDPLTVLAGFPIRFATHCSNSDCDYTGSRLAGW